MAPQHLTNPAGRLLLILQATTGPQTVTCRSLWGNYLGIDADDWSKMFPAIAYIQQLPDEIERVAAAAPSLPIPLELVVRPARNARELLTSDPIGSNGAEQFRAQVQRLSLLSELEYASAILGALPSAERPVEDEAIDRIKELAENLIEAVTSDVSLEGEVREALVRYVHRLIQAADLYKVSGPQALIDEVDRFFTEAARTDLGNRSPTIWKRVQAVTGTVVMAVSLFSAPADIAAAIAMYADAVRQITAGS